ncbi:class I SAM-dependent methyltransferase [Oceanobacillus kapialis]|uniref:Class I SAM-dependent methyltransferase n=1 Tax=Oceanobacillus kapialis TaxID=481353 RepID=A0ABW5PX75_9BACI
MSEHYFSQQPHSKRSPKTWNYTLRGKSYTFTSDGGVFSKDDIDFGSRLLIEQFVEPKIDGDFLDMGCGYGPIGIALADQFPDRDVYMADVNERAVELAEKNTKSNRLSNTTVFQSDLFSKVTKKDFAAILTNPPIRAGKKIVHQLFEDAQSALSKGGELWIVIQKKQGAPSAINKLETLFHEVEVVAKDKGYFILRALNV